MRTSSEPASAIVVAEIMTMDPITTPPDFTAESAGRLLLDKHVGALPVLRNGRLVGVVSKRDFLGYLISLGPSLDLERVWAD